MEGNEVRRILLQNHVNLTWLSEKLGISPQAMSSRLNAKEFKKPYLIEITQILEQDLFGIMDSKKDVRVPILDITISAGDGIALDEGNERTVIEYVTIPSLAGCKGVTVYGESMYPQYKSGDVVFVRQINDISEIDYGRTYLVITREDRRLKMIFESPKGDDYIRLTSYNADTYPDGKRKYPDRDIPKDNILFIYKVVGSLSREQI